jgi:hypothetical protein
VSFRAVPLAKIVDERGESLIDGRAEQSPELFKALLMRMLLRGENATRRAATAVVTFGTASKTDFSAFDSL